LFINDVADDLGKSVSVKLFADDVKLFSVVDCVSPANQLQVALDALVLWSRQWQLPINSSKCNVLHINCHENNVASTYAINSIDILGVKTT